MDPSPEREYHDMAPHSESESGQSRSFGHESIDNQKWLDFDYLHENGLVIVGSPETVARKLRSAAQEGLFNVFCGEFNVGSLTEDSLMRSIKLFGTEVIPALREDRKSTRLNSSHALISYAVFCLKKKNI